jgi:FMN phosphatase YigB (HAD superfamily)
MLSTIVFDVGETLVDETRAWSELADRAGVTRLTFFGALGALIARGEDHRKVWELLGVEQPAADGRIDAGDLYPDALPCLRGVRESGYLIGLAGNQPAAAETSLRELGLPVDFLATSAGWSTEKPSPEFFERICSAAGMPASRIAYVGDRLDNDVLPAKRAGMFAVFIRRGPWGYVHAGLPEADQADAQIETLAELTAVLPS